MLVSIPLCAQGARTGTGWARGRVDHEDEGVPANFTQHGKTLLLAACLWCVVGLLCEYQVLGKGKRNIIEIGEARIGKAAESATLLDPIGRVSYVHSPLLTASPPSHPHRHGDFIILGLVKSEG